MKQTNKQTKENKTQTSQTSKQAKANFLDTASHPESPSPAVVTGSAALSPSPTITEPIRYSEMTRLNW